MALRYNLNKTENQKDETNELKKLFKGIENIDFRNFENLNDEIEFILMDLHSLTKNDKFLTTKVRSLFF